MAAEDNKAVVLRFYEEVINGTDLDAIDELLTPDGVDHTFGSQSAEEAKQFFGMLYQAFPDLRVEVNDVIAEGDLVAARVTYSGTHEGEFVGIPATGQQTQTSGVDFFRMQDGKQAEHWGGPNMASLLQQLGAHLLRNGGDHVGLGEARCHAVHGDALARQLLGQGLGERGHARLGGGVVGLPEVADLTDDRGDVHHPAEALLEHLVDEHLGAVEDPVEIDGQHPAPGGVVHLHEALVRRDAGVVDEDVDVPELLQHVLRHPIGIGVIGHVGLGEHDSAAQLLDLVRHAAGGGLAGDVVDGDVGALLGERERDGASDAAGASGDERGASFEQHGASS